ncbi:glycosyltransferase [bacterium]|nr:glycosyltransferase [bacterium]
MSTTHNTAKKPRITILANSLEAGGAQTQLIRLAKGLKKRGYAVSVITLLPIFDRAESLADYGIHICCMNFERNRPQLSRFFNIISALQQLKTEVLITFMYQANIIGRIAGKLAGVKTIITSLRNEHFGKKSRETLLRWTDVLSTYTTTNSQKAATSFLKRGIVAKKKMVVIPNGINTAEYTTDNFVRAKIRNAMNIAESDFLWLAVGRLEKQKNYPMLLEAFSLVLAEKGWQQKLWIAGEGRERAEIERLVAQLKLEANVNLLGNRDDIPELFSAVDSLVLSSSWEGMPNVIMEAMAAKLSPVATNVGGVAELITDRQNGLLVESGNAEGLASAMIYLASMSIDERQRWGEQGKKHIQQHYDQSVVEQRWIDLIEQSIH